MGDYIHLILIPYVESKHEELRKPTVAALVIFDRFKGQCTPNILSLLSANNIHIAVVQANCTDRLQPLDVSVNKAAKEFLRAKFQTWYSDQVCSTMDNGETNAVVDLKMSIMKPLGVQWRVELYDYLLGKPEIIVNGFQGSGIITTDYLSNCKCITF